MTNIENAIIEAVCDYHSLQFDELIMKRRKRELVIARQWICYFMKVHKVKSLEKIGEIIGGLDHSTVLHGHKTVKNLIDVYPNEKEKEEQLNKLIMKEESLLKTHAFIEIVGHKKLAGTVSEYTVGSTTFLRIDIPATEKHPAHTVIYNPSAIFSINPVTEEEMKIMAEQIKAAPIMLYDLRQMATRMNITIPEHAAVQKNYWDEIDDTDDNEL